MSDQGGQGHGVHSLGACGRTAGVWLALVVSTLPASRRWGPRCDCSVWASGSPHKPASEEGVLTDIRGWTLSPPAK